jgi:hypothetical protein
MKLATALSLGLAAVTAGCSTDQLARAVYYTFRVENQAVNNSITAPMQSRGEPLSYEQYQRERRSEGSR